MDATLFYKYQQGEALIDKVIQRKTERGDLLTEMLQHVNEERVGTKWKSLSIRCLAVKLAHIPTKDLYYIKSISDDSKKRGQSYSKVLFGSIKI